MVGRSSRPELGRRGRTWAERQSWSGLLEVPIPDLGERRRRAEEFGAPAVRRLAV